MSDRRTEANRLNAKKSTGPRTPEGKARSSMNALKHGLLAGARLLPGENRDAYASLLNSWIDRLRPVDATEAAAVEDIVALEWQIRRTRAIESDLLEIECANPEVADGFAALDGNYRVAIAFKRLAEGNNALLLANRQLSRLSREFSRRLKTFLELREKCPPAPSDDPLPVSQPKPPVPEHTTARNEPNQFLVVWHPTREAGRFAFRNSPVPPSKSAAANGFV